MGFPALSCSIKCKQQDQLKKELVLLVKELENVVVSGLVTPVFENVKSEKNIAWPAWANCCTNKIQLEKELENVGVNCFSCSCV